MKRRGALWLIDSMVNLAVLVFFLLLVSYGVYALWDTRQVYAMADSSVYETYKPTADDTDSFGELVELNPEVCGWLSVYGTKIDYPVAQSQDNSKYVNTDARGEYSLAGCLFLDWQNKRDFSDNKSVIYGHHMENGSMFGDLDKFADEAYFEEHRYGNLYFENADHGLEIFAFLHADAYDKNVYQVPANDTETFRSQIEYLKNNAEHYRDIGLSEGDRVVILSTCAVHGTNERTLLAARLSDKTFEDTFQDGDGAENSALAERVKRLPLWWYALVVLLIAMLILMVYLLRRNRVGKRKDRKQKGENRHGKKK